MTAPSPELQQPDTRTRRLALQIEVGVFKGGINGCVEASLLVQADEEVSAGLAALDTVRRVTDLHQPRVWGDGYTKVCGLCSTAWPCATAEAVGA